MRNVNETLRKKPLKKWSTMLYLVLTWGQNETKNNKTKYTEGVRSGRNNKQSGETDAASSRWKTASAIGGQARPYRGSGDPPFCGARIQRGAGGRYRSATRNRQGIRISTLQEQRRSVFRGVQESGPVVSALHAGATRSASRR